MDDTEKAPTPTALDKGDFRYETTSPPGVAEKARPETGVASEHLHRGLSSRQVSMIAIGGTIGTGLFLSTGRALQTGGPASLLINYSIVGVVVFLVMLCLGEMATQYPLAGSFSTYSARFVDEGFGFSIGWNYAFNDAISMAGDLVASQLIMGYWTPHLVWLPAIFFWIFLVTINCIHVRLYGELEYWLSLLKVLSIIIFTIIGIVVNAGANTSHTYIGGVNWTVGAAPFVDGFGGFASLFVSASFAYGGTESIGITAGETSNPTRTVPKVVRNVFFRILIFYVLTIVIIGFDVPYNYPNLATKSTATSPFTIVFSEVGAKAGGSFMNTVILTSILSAANHALYAGSRVLYGLSVVGHAPAVFRRVNRYGVPFLCVAAVSSVSLIFFGSSFLPNGGAQIFIWAQALVGVSNQIAWWCIGVASWRFRRAWKAQGRSVSELKWANPAGTWAAPVVIVTVTVIILVQGWTSFSPFSAVDFVQNYIELPIFALLYVGWRLWKRIRMPSLLDIDLVTGQHEDDERDERLNEIIDSRERGRYRLFWKTFSAVV